MHAWQSIRWQLILRSMSVTLITALLLVLVALGAIFYYYGNMQKSRVVNLAQESAQQMEYKYGTQYNTPLTSVPTITEQRWLDSTYLVAAFSANLSLIYSNAQGSAAALIPPQLLVVKAVNVKVISSNTISNGIAVTDSSTDIAVHGHPTGITSSTLLMTKDLTTIHNAIMKGLSGIATTGNTGSGFIPQPFSVQPFFLDGRQGGKADGVTVVIALSSVNDVIPPFLDTVGGSVLLASPLLATLVALITLGFSRTLTRPLTTLMKATRQLANGDYQTQVKVDAPGEIGELAHHFNEMAAQLQQQELWRRELIMNITHDLATPLTAIAGLGEALMDGMNESQQENEETGEIIVRETLRLHRLVQDLHMMIKVEAKALQPQLQRVCLSVLIDEVLAMLVPAFEQVNVEACNLISPTLPDLQADPDMLKRVFSNLCDNALRHTTTGGFVTFEANQQENYLLISVTDSGTGIPPEALARVFERFFRLDKARHSQTGGSGLGLAIARAIVESHHGQIYAENAPEAGARFIITLPCVRNG